MPRCWLTGVLAFFVLTSVSAQKWRKYEAEADTLLNREQYGKAKALYSKVIKTSKPGTRESYNALYKRAVCSYYLDEPDLALVDLEGYIKEFPDLFQARLLRALIYRDLGEAEKQLEDIDVALKLHPLEPDLMKWRSTLYLDLGRYEKAIEDLNFVESVQNDAEVQMYKGYAWYGLDQLDAALRCMNSAIALDATFMAPYLYSGSFLLDKGEYQEALTYINLALRLDPANSSALFYKGVALIELNKLDEGCSCLNSAFYAGEDGAGDYLEEYCFGSPN